MNFDEALAAIADVDGSGTSLGERAPVWPDFPIEEYRRRYARLSALMEAQDFDALVLTQEEAVRYLTGYNSVIWAVGRWLPTIFIATSRTAFPQKYTHHLLSSYKEANYAYTGSSRILSGQTGSAADSSNRLTSALCRILYDFSCFLY